MKKGIILLMWFITFSQVHATIITVDNNYPRIGNFPNLQEAHDAASSGDTLLVFPSSAHYQAITLEKKLFIIGAGSELIGNTKITFLTGSLLFGPGSDGSVVSSFRSAYGSLVVDINASNIVLKRVHLKNLIVHENSCNVLITGCNVSYFQGIQMKLIEILSGSNVLITNNIIRGTYPNSSGIYQGIVISNSNVLVKNNIIQTSSSSWGGYCIQYSNSDVMVANNILLHGNMTIEEPCVYNNNIGIGINNSYTNLPSCGTSNITGNNSTDDIFIDYENGNYHLKQGSCAIGNGEGGTDIGIYGGEMPYLDGGYPELPAIYFLDVPLTGSQQGGLPITIKAKTNN